MAEQVGQKSWQAWFKIYFGFYVVMMLISIDGIYWAERAVKGHGWDLQSMICMPWVMALMGGALLLIFRNRRKLDDQVAGILLFFLTFVVSSAYSAMSRLAGLVH
jgi:hypothetical protein